MSVTDRWTAFLRRRADAQLDRADLAAMRHGMLPAGWVYGLNDQRHVAFDEQRRILLERSKYLFREPVTGPDGVAVAVFFEGTSDYSAPCLSGTGNGPARRQDGLPPSPIFASAR